MKKRRKSNAVKSVDRFSELPDDVIEKILSSLTLKQAASTSLVSTQWTDLWKLYSGCFDFDRSQTIQDLRKLYVDASKSVFETNFDRERRKFVYWVNHVLHSHKGATMERLRVIFPLSYVSDNVIHDWIQIAASKSVRLLELDLTGCKPPIMSPTIYTFPSRSHCRFRSLTALSLKHVRIVRETLESLLVDCPNLEKLCLCYSGFFQSFFKLYSPSLKHLTLWFFDDTDPKDLKISAPNLLSFIYASYGSTKLGLEDVPRLKYVDIDSHWCPIRSHLSQLHELVWNMSETCDCLRRPLANETELPNLKKFTVKGCLINDQSFSRFVAAVQAAPLLESLTLELMQDVELTEARWKMIQYRRRYTNLKMVKFIGFRRTKDVEIIKYFLNRAPLLEKMIIDPCRPSYLGAVEEISYRESRPYFEDREYVINLIASVPFNISVV